MPQYSPFVLKGGQSLMGASLGFHAYSLRIDNLTNQWLLEESSLAWIPPYSLGTCLRLYGTSVALVVNQAPVGQPQLAPITGEQSAMVFSDQYRTEVGGQAVRQFTLVQSVSDLTEGPQPALPPVGVCRIWADSAGVLHHIHSDGTDATVIDTNTVLGGVLLGKLPNPGMAAGAALTNIKATNPIDFRPNLVYTGDVVVDEGNGTGIVQFPGATTHWLRFDGSQYVFNNAPLSVGGQLLTGVLETDLVSQNPSPAAPATGYVRDWYNLSDSSRRYRTLWTGSTYRFLDTQETTWQSWTPQMVQSAAVSGNGTGWYMQVDKQVIGYGSFTATGPGVNGIPILIQNFPVVPEGTQAGYIPIGVYQYLRSGVTFYSGIMCWANTTNRQANFFQNAQGNTLGATPSFPVAANDSMNIMFAYRAQ